MDGWLLNGKSRQNRVLGFNLGGAGGGPGGARGWGEECQVIEGIISLHDDRVSCKPRTTLISEDASGEPWTTA